MPEEARILLVEDDPVHRMGLKSFLERHGHKIVAEAATFEEAAEVARKLSELEVNVAIVDGNLTPDDTSGNDGRLITDLIRKNGGGIPIVGHSGSRYEGPDAFVVKGFKLGEVLLKVIREL